MGYNFRYATILAFDVKVERDAQELADNVGVKIFTADIIYHLFDSFTNYQVGAPPLSVPPLPVLPLPVLPLPVPPLSLLPSSLSLCISSPSIPPLCLSSISIPYMVVYCLSHQDVVTVGRAGIIPAVMHVNYPQHILT